MFSEADLNANRSGRLSDEQALILNNTAAIMRRRTPRVKALLVVVFAVAIVLLGVGIAQTPGAGITSGVVAAVILGWVGALVFWAMGRNRRYQEAVEHPELITVEGAVSFEPVAFDDSMGGSMYTLRVEGHQLSVTSSQMDAMTDGARYRIHYLKPGIGRAVPSSLERLDA